MNTIRIGIVGAGANTRLRHIPGFRAVSGVELVSVSNRSRESSEGVAAEFGIPRVFDDWQELVADDDIDAVMIGTWPNMHCPVTLAALAADKHVLCEARMAGSAGEARQMLDAARAKPKLITQVVPAPMTLRVDATVQRLLAENYLGEILAIEMRQGGPFLDRDAPLHWRQDIQRSGVNILSMGIWYEALMRWVGEAVRVTARGKIFVAQRSDERGSLRDIEIPEHIDIIADMACGAQGHFQFSAVTGLDGRQGAFLFGSEGTLHITGGRLYGGRRGDDRLKEIEIPAEEEAGWRVEAEFIAAIRGEEPIRRTAFADGLKYMEFTEAVAHSLKSATPVEVGRSH